MIVLIFTKGSFFLPRLDGFLGRYLGLTGARLKGRDVLYVDYIVLTYLVWLELRHIICRVIDSMI